MIGELRTGSLIAILPETDWTDARVVAQRIANDLTVRSSAVTTRKWKAGVSGFPDHGADPPTMVQHAMDDARG